MWGRRDAYDTVATNRRGKLVTWEMSNTSSGRKVEHEMNRKVPMRPVPRRRRKRANRCERLPLPRLSTTLWRALDQ
jgi:hypothetical protein